MSRPLTLFSSLLLLAGAAAAQRMPIPGDPGRMLALVDLRPLFPKEDGPDLVLLPAEPEGARPVPLPKPGVAAEGKEAPVGIAPAPADPVQQAAEATRRAARVEEAALEQRRSSAEGLTEFVRAYVTPPLGPGDDVRLVGDRFLAVLGSQEQVLSVEQLVADAVRQRETAIQFEVRLFEVPPRLYAAEVAAFFDAQGAAANQPSRQLEQQKADALVARLNKADCPSLAAPKVLVRPLQRCHLFTGNHISYIRDFQLERQEGAMIANPMIGTVLDGTSIDAIATVRDGAILLRCTIEDSDVELPIPEFKSDLGAGVPVTVQLPTTRTVRFEHAARLPKATASVVAARRADGTWLLAVVTAAQTALPLQAK